MARYTFRRLTSLPTRDDGWQRLVALGEAGSPAGSILLHHAVLRPGARLPTEELEAATAVIVTLAGRGAFRIEGDRVEVQANEVVTIPAGCPFALETLGGSNWVFLKLQYPSAPILAPEVVKPFEGY